MKPTNPEPVPVPPEPPDDLYMPNSLPGQHFHMDFGFVRGSNYTVKTEDGPTVTSIDGYNSYLIIVDRATRYIWLFLTKSKHPPIDIARKVLKKFRSDHKHCTVRTDQGGELGRSNEFRTMVDDENFCLELTGSDASFQNGIAEAPNKALAQMMRCLLYSSDLGPEYWSYALKHAVMVKNRLPHSSIPTTPYQELTGLKSNVSKLRVFGSRVFARKPGSDKWAKLDKKNTNGIFLGFTATDNNVYFRDDSSGRILTSTHVLFDEAHMSTPSNSTPLGAHSLQRSGYTQDSELAKDTCLRIQHLSPLAKTPTRSTPSSVGLDMYSAQSEPIIILPNGGTASIPTDLAIQPPPGTYAKIASRSGLSFNHNVHVIGGTIDPDYRGNIKVGLRNDSSTPFTITSGDRIAQVILEKALIPDIEVVQSLPPSTRGSQGFGSTEKRPSQPVPPKPTPIPQHLHDQPTTAAAAKMTLPHTSNPAPSSVPTYDPTSAPSPVPMYDPTSAPSPGPTHTPVPQYIDNNSSPLVHNMLTDAEPPFQVTLSPDPIDNIVVIDVPTTGTDPLLGFSLIYNDKANRIQIKHCIPGTPAMRIPKWRSTLRHSYITSVNNVTLTSIAEFKTLVHTARTSGSPTIPISFATIDRQAMHPVLGVPQIHHDQMNIVAAHLNDIAKHTQESRWAAGSDAVTPIINKLTRRKLKVLDDWDDWNKAEFTQLDQYESQSTFGPPCKLPPNANVLHLLWTYVFKEHENRRKARCVCNGAPGRRGSVTLTETYAGALEQTGARIFWAISALHNNIVVAADASNAFAEAPPPKAPLYVHIDKQYREWWESKGRPPIPADVNVMRVKKALQGHPESPRLWATLINKIIIDLGFKPCYHEPCLYVNKNFNGETVYFLRQVDDFAVSASSKTICDSVISAINSKMTIDIKSLGTVNRFNGVDIDQTQEYIKVSTGTYIKKILTSKGWLDAAIPDNSTIKYTPMHSDNTYNKLIDESIPIPDKELPAVEKEMGFTYKQGIGELIYALVTCRPDISFPLIKLSQHSTKPSRLHFEAVRGIYAYLKQTQEVGIHYWRPKPRMDLPLKDRPTPLTDYNNYVPDPDKQPTDPSLIQLHVDAAYANDPNHRRSVTGILARLAGGTIMYKTRFQDTVALSSTEAEFIAACDAGKNCLYLRSILNDLGIEQKEATVIYEDNQGVILMANAGKPTKRTRHVDTKYFAIQSWVEQDLLRFKHISTSDNSSDALTKNVPRILFNRHSDFILGRTVPDYVTNTSSVRDSYALNHTA